MKTEQDVIDELVFEAPDFEPTQERFEAFLRWYPEHAEGLREWWAVWLVVKDTNEDEVDPTPSTLAEKLAHERWVKGIIDRALAKLFKN